MSPQGRTKGALWTVRPFSLRANKLFIKGMEVEKNIAAETVPEAALKTDRDTKKTPPLYLVTLAIITMLATARGVIEHSIVHQQAVSADIMNTAGRQNTRVQHIAWLANAFDRMPPARRAVFRQDLAAMLGSLRIGQDLLTKGEYVLPHDAPLARDIDNIYYGKSWHLDAYMRDFIDASQRFLDAKTAAARAPLAAKIGDLGFRQIMDKQDMVISMYQANDDKTTQSLAAISLACYIGTLLALIVQGSFVFLPLVKRVTAQESALARQADTDALTGCHNRVTFFHVAGAVMANARRQGGRLGALALDVDHFRRINDVHGNACGDAALAVFAEAVTDALRQGDVIGRLGGTEFAVILPGTDEDSAARVGEKLRLAVENLTFSLDGTDIPLTASIGVAILREQDTRPEDVLQRAALALAAAKKAGGNAVRVHYA